MKFPVNSSPGADHQEETKFDVGHKASRRTADGGLQRAIFNRIGGKEVPRYAALTWEERDAAHKEFPVVKGRYERHMSRVN